MARKPKSHIDYSVMTSAIAGAALSRRAALQMELAVSLVHFTQEMGGTDTSGKANLKAVYQGAGYLCMAKADRDYKTVNRRLNAMAKAFDKIGSSLVFGWMEKGGKDTQDILNAVQGELVAFGFDTLDDVLEYVGTDTNRTRAPRQPVAAPVSVVTVEESDDGEAAEQAPAPTFNAEATYAAIVSSMNADEIREFCTKLLVHVATVEVAAAEEAPAAVVQPEEMEVETVVAQAVADTVPETGTIKAMFPAAPVMGRKARRAAEQAARATSMAQAA